MKMKRFLLLVLILLGIIIQIHADRYESVLVDTIYCEPNSMTGDIIYNMEYDYYCHYPNEPSLIIAYGTRPDIGPGVTECRSFVTFETKPVPNDYIISSVMFRLKCGYYWDNDIEYVWPHYYSTPYSVIIDHIQYETLEPSVFDLEPLTSNVGVLQDSAYVGWVSSPVTESYLDDVEQSREYSQFRLRFPPGHDIIGYSTDLVVYNHAPSSFGSFNPNLIVTYHKSVSNSQEVEPMQTQLIRQVYPQPSKNSVNIEFMDKDNKLINLSLYDLRGRLVHYKINVAKKNGIAKIPTLVYPSGIYFLKVKADNKSEVRKITILK